MPSIDLEAFRQELINHLQQDQSAESETRPTEAKFANRTIKHIANTDNASLNAFLAQKGSLSDLEAICKQLLDRDISPSEANNPKLLAKTIFEKLKDEKAASDNGSHSSGYESDSSGYSSAPSSLGWSSTPDSPRTDSVSEKDSPNEWQKPKLWSEEAQWLHETREWIDTHTVTQPNSNTSNSVLTPDSISDLSTKKPVPKSTAQNVQSMDKQPSPVRAAPANLSPELQQLQDEVKQKHGKKQLSQAERSQLDKTRTALFQKEGIPHYNVVVAGLGPAGLMAAIKLAKEGKSVCAIESRSQEEWDIRSNGLRVPNNISKELINALGNQLEPVLGSDYVFSHKEKRDHAHHKSLKQLKERFEKDQSCSSSTVQTDVMQRIFYNLVKHIYKDNVDIKFGSAVSDLDSWLQTAQLSDGQTAVAFDSIVHADGIRASSQKVVAKQLGLPMNYTTRKWSRQKAQSAYLECPAFTRMDFYRFFSEGMDNVDTKFKEQLRQFGWVKDQLPPGYISKPSPESKKLWIATVCPDDLTADKQLEWNRLLCRIAMEDIDASDNLEAMKFITSNQTTGRGRKKETLSSAIFDIQKRTLKKPILNLPFGQSHAIGDAAATPIFLHGEGVRNAARNVSALRIQPPYREQS